MMIQRPRGSGLSQSPQPVRPLGHAFDRPASAGRRDARAVETHNQDFRFPSFPRKRESSMPLKKLDSRFHGYDDQSFQRMS
jgi:hypothetical protein